MTQLLMVDVALVGLFAFWVWWVVGSAEARLRGRIEGQARLVALQVDALRGWLKAEAEAQRERPVVVTSEPEPVEVSRGFEPPTPRDVATVEFRALPARAPSPVVREPQVTLILTDAHEDVEEARMTVTGRRRPREVTHNDAKYVQARVREDGAVLYRRER